MLCTWMLFFTVAMDVTSAAPDSQMAETVLSEIRALRLDLRNVAATIQRVQIAMYRLQAQDAVVDKVTQRVEMARGVCKQAQEQQKATAAQLELIKKQSSQNGVDQKQIEQEIAMLQGTLEVWNGQSQQCQVDQVDAEGQFRVEQAKRSELENQLEQLDRILAGQERK